MNDTDQPKYRLISLDIASRIATGELPLKQKISGRSLLASEYGVSPETIRRSLKLLLDMKVVEIRGGSGVYAVSVDTAKRYVESFDGERERIGLENRFKELVSRHSDLSLQILDIASEMTRASQISKPPMPYFEEKVAKNSPLIGKSIGQVQFWQLTGATIVGIRRAKRVILSPGPDAEIFDGDSIIFVGAQNAVDMVRNLLNGKPVNDVSKS